MKSAPSLSATLNSHGIVPRHLWGAAQEIRDTNGGELDWQGLLDAFRTFDWRQFSFELGLVPILT